MNNKQLDKSKKYRLGPDVYEWSDSGCYWCPSAGTSFDWPQLKHLYNLGVVTEVAEPITITFKAYPMSEPIPDDAEVASYDPNYGWGSETAEGDTHWAYADDMKPKVKVPK